MIFEKEVNVHCWSSSARNAPNEWYMGKIEVSSTKLGRYVGKRVRIKVEAIG